MSSRYFILDDPESTDANPKKQVGRSERIRTSGPCVPNAVLYQAELFPDTFCCSFLLPCEARNYISVFAELQSPIIVATHP